MSEKWNESSSERRTIPVDVAADRPLSVESIEAATEREGLPRSYRMRADSHYVDQLASASGNPVRMIPISQIDGPAMGSESDLRPLIESVRLHGIVQPLLVRRVEGRYAIVAGRKRLASAQMLQLPTVPCVIRDVLEAEAASLQAADNLRLQVPGQALLEPADTTSIDRFLAEQVSAIRKCADLVAAPGMLNRAALDLLKANIWRAERFVGALGLVRNAIFPVEHERALASIVDAVIDGFQPECRLMAVTLRSEVREPLTSSGLNGGQLFAGLAGAVMATLPLLQDTIRPTITLRVTSQEGSGVSCDILQADAAVSGAVAANFFGDPKAIELHGGPAATVGALAAKALAEQHRGFATFESFEIGSKLTLWLMRRS